MKDDTVQTSDDTSCSPEGRRGGLAGAAMLVLAVTLARIVYLVAMCPYQLVEDEAHYWEWSRRLDWSYYSKGPGVAMVIRAMTELFGHAEWAVRLPAAIAGGVAAMCVAGLARDTARHAGVRDTSRVALWAAGAFVLAPMFQVPAVLMTIDGPYVACWAAACWAAWRGLMGRSRGAWLGLGVALGVGFAFKYTIVLLVPGLVMYAIMARRRLELPARAWGWIAACAAVALGGLVPVAVWNAQRGWPTVKHLMGHLGMAGGDVPVASDDGGKRSVLEIMGGVGGFVGAQIGMVGPMLALGVAGWWFVRKHARDADRGDDGARFLVLTALPIIMIYLGVTFVAEAEQNWAMGGYVTLMALAGWAAAVARTRPRGERHGTRGIRRLWKAGLVYGVCAVFVLHRGDLVARAAGAVLNRPVTLGRLSGSSEMAQETLALVSKIEQQTGRPGFIVTDHYGRASLMAYYTFRLGHGVEVYCTSALMGGRKTQYDMWPETDLTSSSVNEHLTGRDAVLFSNDKAWKLAQWEQFFRRVEPIGKLAGEHKKDRIAYRGFGYHGLVGARHRRHGAQEETQP